MTFGQRLYTLREERGWSQDELAERAEVTRQTVSNWENDKVQIDAEKLKRLAQIFGVGMDELYSAAQPAPQKKLRVVSFVVLVAAIASALVALVLSVIGLFLADASEASFSISLNGVFGICVAIVLSVAVLAVCIVILIKSFRKK